MGDVCSLLPWNTDCEIANRIDRKVFLSNERTVNDWFRTAVTLGTAGAAVVGVSDGETPGGGGTARNVVGICLCGMAVFMAIYAITRFYQRARKIRLAIEGPYEDMVGPGLTCGLVVSGLVALISYNLYELAS